MEKTCPEHGNFRTLLWNGPPDYDDWARKRPPAALASCHAVPVKGCPYDCGICPDHRQNTCCVLLDVTERCNLLCPVCYASSASVSSLDPDLREIGEWMDMLMASGGPYNIQLSGGEPTMRDDIPQIIMLGKGKGFNFFQLNTNGLRMAREPGYVSELRDAGLNCVFLQFDGLRDEIYEKLRGRPLLEEKLKAIDRCAAAGIGVVLVPTVASGVNDGDIGDILNFAVKRMPAVRGVHFQPVSYFGRYPDWERKYITIPDMLRHIEKQTGGKMKIGDFKPGAAEDAYCSFNGSFLLRMDGTLKSFAVLKQPEKTAGGCCGDSARSREYVARRWSATPSSCCDDQNADPQSLEGFLERARKYTLAVSGMVFQDAWNLDLDRLKSCYIHVVSPDRRLIPFCAYNLTALGGKTLYRGRQREEGGPAPSKRRCQCAGV
ncbi:MAG: radical SAM protein [Synergistaceae bacterium]|nr:radical SAM protein [Synergistaceae bacterium]